MLFWIYFLGTGIGLTLLTSWVIENPTKVMDKYKDPDEFLQTIGEINLIKEKMNIYPLLTIVCFVFGWIVMPATIIIELMRKIKF